MVKQLLVSGSVDFLTQNLGSAGNSQLSNLISQGVTGRLNFLSSLSTSSGDNLIGLNLCLSFCFFNNGLATLFALGHDDLRLGTCSGFDRSAFFLGFFQSMFAAISCGKAVSYLFLPLFDCSIERWPNELHGDPGTKEEHDHL